MYPNLHTFFASYFHEMWNTHPLNGDDPELKAKILKDEMSWEIIVQNFRSTKKVVCCRNNCCNSHAAWTTRSGVRIKAKLAVSGYTLFGVS